MKDKIVQILKILISMLLMYLLIKQINYEEFKDALENVSVFGVMSVVIAYLLSIIVNALKWKVLLPETELMFLIVLCFRAQFFATVLPGQLFGEASKVTVWKNRLVRLCGQKIQRLSTVFIRHLLYNADCGICAVLP